MKIMYKKSLNVLKNVKMFLQIAYLPDNTYKNINKYFIIAIE